MNPQVESFRDPLTSTFSYVVYDAPGGHAAIIDPVLDYDSPSARTDTALADRLLAFVRKHDLKVDWILETHAHADHLSAGGYLRDQLGAKLAIGRGIITVQERFKQLFNLDPDFVADGSQFDHLFNEGETFTIGGLTGHTLATPGHTDDSLTYVIGDAAFIGDTMFAPDTGTARCDFPGGDAHKLYDSIHKIFGLPADTRIFLCHDYPPGDREPAAQTSVAAQQTSNVHVRDGVSEADFVRMRNERDASLPEPKLILPALQVNIRGGRLPPPDGNGISYLRLPLNQIGHDA
ncbi:MAG: MBL fold metallo-hydrolase [Lysobacter sp.]|nr:MBL fold metallo-hydrolase [Lysobacter sp.]